MTIGLRGGYLLILYFFLFSHTMVQSQELPSVCNGCFLEGITAYVNCSIPNSAGECTETILNIEECPEGPFNITSSGEMVCGNSEGQSLNKPTTSSCPLPLYCEGRNGMKEPKTSLKSFKPPSNPPKTTSNKSS